MWRGGPRGWENVPAIAAKNIAPFNCMSFKTNFKLKCVFIPLYYGPTGPQILCVRVGGST